MGFRRWERGVSHPPPHPVRHVDSRGTWGPSHRYGRPPEGSLTEARGIKAHLHVHKEIEELCGVIKTYGREQSDGWVSPYPYSPHYHPFSNGQCHTGDHVWTHLLDLRGHLGQGGGTAATCPETRSGGL